MIADAIVNDPWLVSDPDNPACDIDVLHGHQGTDCGNEGKGYILEELVELPTGGKISVVASSAWSSFAGKSQAVDKHDNSVKLCDCDYENAIIGGASSSEDRAQR